MFLAVTVSVSGQVPGTFFMHSSVGTPTTKTILPEQLIWVRTSKAWFFTVDTLAKGKTITQGIADGDVIAYTIDEHPKRSDSNQVTAFGYVTLRYLNNNITSSQWIANGSEIYFPDNVGVGVTNPSYRLHVSGSLGLTSDGVAVTSSTSGGSSYYGGYFVNSGAGGTGVYGGGTSASGQTKGVWGSGYYGVYAGSGASGGAGVYSSVSGGAYSGLFLGGNVGIGTTAPTSKLHVVGTTYLNGKTTTADTAIFPYINSSAETRFVTNTSSGFVMLGYGYGLGVVWRRANGTFSTPTKVNSGDVLGSFQFGGHDGSAFDNNKAAIQVKATENFDVGNGTQFIFGTTPNGSSTRTDRLCIDQSGYIGIGTTSPTTYIDINGDKFRVRTAKTITNSTDSGTVGDICWDASYIYICVATDTWKRVSISTW